LRREKRREYEISRNKIRQWLQKQDIHCINL
jgi:hypothetical protein